MPAAFSMSDAPQYPTLAETFPGFDVNAFQAVAVPSDAITRKEIERWTAIAKPANITVD
jgi:hypothetical protein